MLGSKCDGIGSKCSVEVRSWIEVLLNTVETARFIGRIPVQRARKLATCMGLIISLKWIQVSRREDQCPTYDVKVPPRTSLAGKTTKCLERT
jgi:hypothetical protein